METPTFSMATVGQDGTLEGKALKGQVFCYLGHQRFGLHGNSPGVSKLSRGGAWATERNRRCSLGKGQLFPWRGLEN